MDVLSPRARPAGGASTASAAARLRRWLWGLVALTLVARLATLGAYPLMDNTEARYAEIARKMLETGDWLMPQFHYGVPFWSKPPLAVWLTAASFGAFGVNEFAARLPALLCCLAVAFLTWLLARRTDGPDVAVKTVAVLVTTVLFFVAAGAVMTDAELAVGTTLSMVAFREAVVERGSRGRLWGYAFFVGLAIGLMAKGPVAVVLLRRPGRRLDGVATRLPCRVVAAALAQRPRSLRDPGRAVVLARGVAHAGFPRLLPDRRALEALHGQRLVRATCSAPRTRRPRGADLAACDRMRRCPGARFGRC